MLGSAAPWKPPPGRHHCGSWLGDSCRAGPRPARGSQERQRHVGPGPSQPDASRTTRKSHIPGSGPRPRWQRQQSARGPGQPHLPLPTHKGGRTFPCVSHWFSDLHATRGGGGTHIHRELVLPLRAFFLSKTTQKSCSGWRGDRTCQEPRHLLTDVWCLISTNEQTQNRTGKNPGKEGCLSLMSNERTVSAGTLTTPKTDAA